LGRLLGAAFLLAFFFFLKLSAEVIFMSPLFIKISCDKVSQLQFPPSVGTKPFSGSVSDVGRFLSHARPSSRHAPRVGSPPSFISVCLFPTYHP